MNITKKHTERGAEIAQKLKADKVWVNERGEFFTNQSFAAHSVGGGSDKYALVFPGIAVSEKSDDAKVAKKKASGKTVANEEIPESDATKDGEKE